MTVSREKAQNPNSLCCFSMLSTVGLQQLRALRYLPPIIKGIRKHSLWKQYLQVKKLTAALVPVFTVNFGDVITVTVMLQLYSISPNAKFSHIPKSKSMTHITRCHCTPDSSSSQLAPGRTVYIKQPFLQEQTKGEHW